MKYTIYKDKQKEGNIIIKKKTFSIDEKILADFTKKAKDNALNMSQWVQIKMVEYLKEGEK